jgi:hypothetical protein
MRGVVGTTSELRLVPGLSSLFRCRHGRKGRTGNWVSILIIYVFDRPKHAPAIDEHSDMDLLPLIACTRKNSHVDEGMVIIVPNGGNHFIQQPSL